MDGCGRHDYRYDCVECGFQWKDKVVITDTPHRRGPTVLATFSGCSEWFVGGRFDGTDDYLNGSGITNIGSFTIFAVTNRHTVDSADEALLGSDGSWASNMLLIRNRGTTNLTNKLDINGGGAIADQPCCSQQLGD